MDLREVGYDDRDWINLAQNRDRWRAYLTESIYHSCLGKFPQAPSPCRSEAKLFPRVGPPRVPLQKPSNIAELHFTEAGRETPVDCEVRSVIKFLNSQGIALIEIDRQLCHVYGPNVMSKQMVRCSTKSSLVSWIHEKEMKAEFIQQK
ncbi:hypothetical protein ANN_11567 [Periplaneta americana]|uniref:Uncharacterized protein n=1 Tax=Periplaneta americana TaxID=6978 RepID=A0ABQ8T6S1_PERAM|nr:hypothetical protein ANN_11567 [Periplaneta americana]